MLLELARPLRLQVSEEKIADLPVSGFNVNQEVQNLFVDYQTDPEMAFARTRTNILSWLREYPLRMVVLPIEIKVKEVSGQKKIFHVEENKKSWIDSVIAQERNGAVTDTCQEIEPFLLEAPPGSLAFFVSPKGRTGLLNQQGLEIIHPDTQIYVYAINEKGELVGNTLVTDIELEENEKFLAHISDFEASDGGRDERIEGVIRNPIFWEATGFRFFNVEDVIDKIQEILQKTEDVETLYAGLEKKEIANFGVIENVVDNLEGAIAPLLTDLANEKLIRQKLTEVLLACSRLTREEEREYSYAWEKVPFYTPSRSIIPRYTFIDYWDEAARLYQIGGCAGGACAIKTDEGTIAETKIGATIYSTSDKKSEEEKNLCTGCGKNPKSTGGLCASCSKKG